MYEGFVGPLIRRLNLKTLLISLAGLALVFVGLLVSSRYLSNLMLGPDSIQSSALLAVTDASKLPRYYVTVQGDDTGDTGITYGVTSSSGQKTIRAYYLALLFGNRILLVKSQSATIGTTLTGALENIPSDVKTNVIDPVEANTPQAKGAFLPVMLDTGSFAGRGSFGLILAALVALACLIGLALSVYRLARPEAHPAVKALRRFGAPESVMREIDMDMSMNPQKLGKSTTLSSHWLVSTQNGFQAAPYRDMVWVYKLVTQHRTNGIPTRKSYAVKIFDRYSKAITLTGKEPAVDEIVQAIAARTPGAALGYSDPISKMWNQDRAGFIQAVDQRRAGG